MVLHNHLQLSFQSLSLHCRCWPQYWLSGSLVVVSVIRIETSLQCFHMGRLTLMILMTLRELHWLICSCNRSSVNKIIIIVCSCFVFAPLRLLNITITMIVSEVVIIKPQPQSLIHR